MKKWYNIKDLKSKKFIVFNIRKRPRISEKRKENK